MPHARHRDQKLPNSQLLSDRDKRIMPGIASPAVTCSAGKATLFLPMPSSVQPAAGRAGTARAPDTDVVTVRSVTSAGDFVAARLQIEP
jgi:hypothetical protein